MFKRLMATVTALAGFAVATLPAVAWFGPGPFWGPFGFGCGFGCGFGFLGFPFAPFGCFGPFFPFGPCW